VAATYDNGIKSAARADGALLRNDRRDANVQELEQSFDERGSHRGMAARQVVGANQYDRARRGDRSRRAGAVAEAVHEPDLQRPRLGRADLTLGGVAEPGGDSIDGLAARDVLRGELPTGLDDLARAGIGREADAGAAARDPLDLVQLEAPPVQDDRLGGLQRLMHAAEHRTRARRASCRSC
jgi:hypothetical protein